MRSDQSLLGYHICQPFSISSSSAPGTTHKASRTRVNLWLAIFLISNCRRWTRYSQWWSCIVRCQWPLSPSWGHFRGHRNQIWFCHFWIEHEAYLRRLGYSSSENSGVTAHVANKTNFGCLLYLQICQQTTKGKVGPMLTEADVNYGVKLVTLPNFSKRTMDLYS